MTTEEKSFIQTIWENRFIKSIVPYVIGAWGIIQVSAFLESRYTWAKGWPDFILIFALVMLPAVFLFSYHRGKNKGKLTKTERFIIPANIVVALILAFFGMGSGDAVETGSKVSITTEDGEVQERFVPNASTTKRIVLIPWKNISDDTDSELLSFGLPLVLDADLEQDSRVIAISPNELYDEYAEYEVSLGDSPPLSIQRKMALDNYTDYFLNGTIEKDGEVYKVTTKLMTTKNGSEHYVKSYENKDPFDIIDQITEDFRKEVYVENEISENFVDLPVSNLYTSSMDAFKTFIEGIQKAYFEKNVQGGIQKMEQAVETDPRFAVAYNTLGALYRNNNEGIKSKAAAKKALSLSDALSERMQFMIKYSNLRLENPVKSIALLEMWSELHPMDFKPYGLLIGMYKGINETDKSKLTAEKALAKGHSGNVLLTLADLENTQGNFDQAEAYYDRFEKEFPHKKSEIIGKGNIYMAKGEFDKAQKHFEQMNVLDATNADVIKKLAEIQGKKGNFEKQLELLDEALVQEKQYMDSIYILQAKEIILLNKGQIKQYFEALEERWEKAKKINPNYPHRAELLAPHNLVAMIHQEGRTGVLEELLDLASQVKGFPGNYECMVKGNYYIFSEDPINLKTALSECGDELLKYQTGVQSAIVNAFAQKVYGNYEKALEEILAAQKTSKIDSGLNSVIGELYLLNKEYTKAETYLKKFLSQYPYEASVLVDLSKTYQGMNKMDLAKSTLQKAIEVWKDADDNYTPANKAKALMLEFDK